MSQRMRRPLVVKMMATLIGALLATTPALAAPLDVWHIWGGHREQLLNDVLAAFEAEHPGIETMQTLHVFPQHQERFIAGVLAGVVPDIIMIHSSELPGLVDSLDPFIPLDEFLARDGLHESAWYPSEYDAGVWNGHVYGLPMRTGGDANTLVMYNGSVFEEVGLDANVFPKTWNEFAEVSRKLVRYDGDTISRLAFMPEGANADMDRAAWLYAGGATLVSEDATRVTFADTAAIQAVEFIHELGSQLYRNPQDGVPANAIRQLVDGGLAMRFVGSWGYAEAKDVDPNADIRIALRPSKDGVQYAGVHAGTWLYMIPKGVDNVEHAWELLKWLTTEEGGAGRFMLEQSRPSPIRDHNANPAYRDLNPYWDVIGLALGSSAPLPKSPIVPSVDLEFQKAFVAAVRGQQAVASALTEAARVAQGLVDEYLAGK